MATTKSRSIFRRCAALGLTALLAAGGISGCGGGDDAPITAASSQYQVADEGDSAENGNAGSASQANRSSGSAAARDVPTGGNASPPDSTAATPGGDFPKPPATGPPLEPTPDMSPQELLALIARLRMQVQQRGPQGATEEEQRAEFERTFRTMIKAAEMVLQSDAEPQLRMGAVQSKIVALETLRQNGFAGIDEQLAEFVADLSKDAEPQIAKTGRMLAINLHAQQYATGASNDVQPLIDALTSFVRDFQDDDLQQNAEFAQAVIQSLEDNQNNENARQAFEAVGAALKESKNAEAPELANIFFDRAKLHELGFTAKFQAALKNVDEGMPAVSAVIEELLTRDPPSPVALELGMQISEVLEMQLHRPELALQLQTRLGQAFENHPNEEVAESAVARIATGKQRLGLLGQPFSVQGVLLDGSPFDWSKYQGKVVLVDFWATWCVPCLQELPNMEAAYETYKDQGFEIVGVNINDQNDPRQKAELEQFFRLKELPWATIYSDDLEQQGFDDPNAVKCGVEAIPFMVLVDREGKVAALHARGEYLNEKLAEMLGPPADESKGDSNNPSNDADSNDAESKPAEGDAAPKESAADQPEADTGAALLLPRNSERRQTAFVAFRDEPSKDDTPESTEDTAESGDSQQVNPYLAPAGLSPRDLVGYLLDMEEKPRSIRQRPGFAAAVVEAADRLLTAETSDKFQQIAAEIKFAVLHRAASLGDEAADAQLVKFVATMQDDARPKIARQVTFFQLERRVIEADELPEDQIEPLLAELKKFYTGRELTDKHLRIASSTVRLINRLEDGERREEHFGQFGKQFAESENSELARYGRKLAKAPEQSMAELVGKPLDVTGVTILGTAFDWSAYRGKVVLVDFWATWCGPCRRELPQVRAMYQQHKDRGFDVVAVSLDKDLAALGKYLDEEKIPWTNLAGDEAEALASKYGVRGIPTMILVDQEGNVVDVAHQAANLADKAAQLLNAPAAEPAA